MRTLLKNLKKIENNNNGAVKQIKTNWEPELIQAYLTTYPTTYRQVLFCVPLISVVDILSTP